MTNMKHFNIREVQVTKDVAKMVRFRINDGWDYVWVTYQEEKGFISISSSFGNYSYIWSSMGEGTKLPEFFARADNQYLAHKLFVDSKQEKHTFSFSQAIEELKEELFEIRKEKFMSAEEARDIYNDIVEFSDDHEADTIKETFYYNFTNYKALAAWNPEYWDGDYGRGVSGSFLVLQDEIVPLIKNYFTALAKEHPTSLEEILK